MKKIKELINITRSGDLTEEQAERLGLSGKKDFLYEVYMKNKASSSFELQEPTKCCVLTKCGKVEVKGLLESALNSIQLKINKDVLDCSDFICGVGGLTSSDLNEIKLIAPECFEKFFLSGEEYLIAVEYGIF